MVEARLETLISTKESPSLSEHEMKDDESLEAESSEFIRRNNAYFARGF
jgi:hypothetical protein